MFTVGITLYTIIPYRLLEDFPFLFIFRRVIVIFTFPMFHFYPYVKLILFPFITSII